MMAKDPISQYGKFLAYAWSLCHDYDHANDLVQEAFLRYLECKAKHEAVAHPIAFIATIIKRIHFDERKKLTEIPTDYNQLESGEIPGTEILLDNSLGPITLLEEAEMAEIVSRILANVESNEPTEPA
jgi:DNA-directed RNA polymerase specialized sigma24 family protein